MDNLPASPIEEINSAIQADNPFKHAGIVTQQNVWGKTFPDLTTLNQKASDTVFEAIEKVKTSQQRHEKVTSLVITSDPGVGKTHLLSRIRHHLKQQGESLFIYSSIQSYSDLNLIKYNFQQTLIESLSYTGSQGVMQWQEVAASLANDGFQALSSKYKKQSPAQLIQKFDKAYQQKLAKNQNLIDILVQQILKSKPQADPYIIRAVLWLLSKSKYPFALKWLSGDELDPATAQDMGLPTHANKTNQQKENDALNTSLQILNLVTVYKPVIVCFDEFESLDVNDAGFTAPQVVADLVSTLYDQLEVEFMGQGVIILTVVLSNKWRDELQFMSGGIKDRLSKYTGNKPLELKPLNGELFLELVKLWLKEFYQQQNLIPPHPLYPFQESDLLKFGANKPTVREGLSWCAKNFKPPENLLPDEPSERFQLALQTVRAKNKAATLDALDDNEASQLIAAALKFGFQTLVGATLSGQTPSGEPLNNVQISAIEEITPKSKNKDWINFKLVGEENGEPFKLGLAVMDHTHGKSVTAALERLVNYETFDLTRGCFVRSAEKKIPKSWRASEHLEVLLANAGEWVDLKFTELQPLLELYFVFEQRENYNLTEEQVIQFSKPDTIQNPLLLEILSSPAGIIEDIINLFEEDDEEDFIDDVFADDEKQDEDGTIYENQPKNQENIDEDNRLDISTAFEQDDEADYQGKSIQSFTLANQRYEVRYWKELLVKSSEIMYEHHGKDFEKVLQLVSKRKKLPYFSHTPEDFRNSSQIGNSQFYVDTNFNANQIVNLAKRIIGLFGYTEDSLTIETKD